MNQSNRHGIRLGFAIFQISPSTDFNDFPTVQLFQALPNLRYAYIDTSGHEVLRFIAYVSNIKLCIGKDIQVFCCSVRVINNWYC